MRIAIVSFEFEGLTKNGGIGTAYRRMADLLVRDGHHVSLLFMPFNLPESKKDKILFKKKLAQLRRNRINVILPDNGRFEFQLKFDFYHQRRALLVYDALKKNSFDVVHAPDNCGLLYFSLLAKKAGSHFGKTKFVVGAHGSPYWAADANGEFTAESVQLSQYDKISVALADYLVSPSYYMLNYLKQLDWPLPDKSFAFPNVNNFSQKKIQITANNRSKSLVFFGRLERRKGLFLFVESIVHLLNRDASIGLKKPLKIFFVGSETSNLLDPLPSEYVKQRLQSYKDRIKLHFFTKLSSQESNDFLKNEEPKLVCMPSLTDNSPYVIVEALENHLDFLATDSGGQAELIDKRDHASVLVVPESEALALAIQKRLAMPAFMARPSKNVLQANAWWSNFHKKIKKNVSKEKPGKQKMLSVFIGFQSCHEEESHFVSLKSLHAQNYNNIELIIGPAIRNKEEIISLFPKAKVLHNNFFKALSKARGVYFLNLDGLELLQKNSLNALTRAFERNQVDMRRLLAVTPTVLSSLNHPDREEWSVPVPASIDRIAAGQILASTFALWHRQRFLKISHANHHSMFLHDLFLRPFVAQAFLHGFQFASLPEALFRSLTPDWIRLAHKPSDSTFLEPLLSSFPKEKRNLLPALLGFAKDYDLFRSAYYSERDKRLSKQ